LGAKNIAITMLRIATTKGTKVYMRVTSIFINECEIEEGEGKLKDILGGLSNRPSFIFY